MPKLKSHSSSKKRFKLTASGKIKRAKAFKRHILTKITFSSKQKNMINWGLKK